MSSSARQRCSGNLTLLSVPATSASPQVVLPGRSYVLVREPQEQRLQVFVLALDDVGERLRQLLDGHAFPAEARAVDLTRSRHPQIARAPQPLLRHADGLAELLRCRDL